MIISNTNQPALETFLNLLKLFFQQILKLFYPPKVGPSSGGLYGVPFESLSVLYN